MKYKKIKIDEIVADASTQNSHLRSIKDTNNDSNKNYYKMCEFFREKYWTTFKGYTQCNNIERVRKMTWVNTKRSNFVEKKIKFYKNMNFNPLIYKFSALELDKLLWEIGSVDLSWTYA